ncbi:hypothetical protein [Spirosoma endbachense]|uniref:Transposase IS200-like domain-containing protein n=1 Tax=Spirosoma endbachense TaxID=2666025 RepID=A0A6P1VN44_9BACT|nr:hypothetical protein [Spirosoma endbachense]QHV94115.1 hypothetical protein GJR95_03315 [Spirosoma endbachense]
MYSNPLLPGQYYHLYNHAVGNENLFRQPANYQFFLDRYRSYIFPIARTYAYCLMPNHFHLLVQIREEAELINHNRQLKKRPSEQKDSLLDVSSFVMQQFSNFFNSYAKAFNRRFDRKGALFLDYLRRKPVETEAYFTTLMVYIHRNPIHHGFCQNVNDWVYSSLHSISSSKSTRLERNAVLDWFGGVEPYLAFHEQNCIIPTDEDWEFGD